MRFTPKPCLETTHFKAGFLGIPPDFESTTVYRSGLARQVPYQAARLRKMLGNPRYLNSSLIDTYSGAYYRSIQPKKHYFHLFDYFDWNEAEINKVLVSDYGWEFGERNITSWRNGDATASFYNFVYHYVAGFTEHDTLRSNQVREGQITREHALSLVEKENRPNPQNIYWYLQAAGVNPETIIRAVLSMRRLN